MPTLEIQVKMKRGGKIPALVSGRTYREGDGSGNHWTEVEIDSIEWLGGGHIKHGHLADIGQVQEAFAEVLESHYN